MWLDRKYDSDLLDLLRSGRLVSLAADNISVVWDNIISSPDNINAFSDNNSLDMFDQYPFLIEKTEF